MTGGLSPSGDLVHIPPDRDQRRLRLLRLSLEMARRSGCPGCGCCDETIAEIERLTGKPAAELITEERW